MPFEKGRSGNPKGRKRKADAAAERADGWSSLINGLGHSDYDKRLSVTFGAVTPVDDATAEALWRGNDLAKKVIEKLPKHEVRAGFDLEIRDDDSAEGDDEDGGDELVEDARARPLRTDAVAIPEGEPDPAVVEAKKAGTVKRLREARASRNAHERAEKVKTLWKTLGAIMKIREARFYQRAKGGAAIFLGVEDNQTVDKPLDLARVRSVKFLTVLEKRELQPIYYYADPLAPKFGEPEIWAMMPSTPGMPRPGAGTRGIAIPRYTLVHESRLIIFSGTVVSRIVQSGTTPGFGDSVLTPIYDVLRDFGIGWSAAGILLADFSQAVMKIKGLAEMLAADDPESGPDAFVNRMRNHERMRSVARVNVIDADEEYERKATPVTGLAELLETFKARVAAAADMPVTELFGTSASGLNATGEGDRKSWFGEVAASRDEHVLPALERITECCLAATGTMPDSWCIEPRPLEQMTAKEIAEIEKLEAEGDSIRIGDGVASPEEVAISRFSDGTRGIKIDFDAREALEAAAAKPVETEGKDPDLQPPPVIGPNGEEVPHGATIMDPPKDEAKAPGR